jgi:hypothetical protein
MSSASSIGDSFDGSIFDVTMVKSVKTSALVAKVNVIVLSKGIIQHEESEACYILKQHVGAQ